MLKDVIQLFGVWLAMFCNAAMKGCKAVESRLPCSIRLMLSERHTAVWRCSERAAESRSRLVGKNGDAPEFLRVVQGRLTTLAEVLAVASLNAALLLLLRSIHKKSENVLLFSGPQDFGRIRNLWMRLFFFHDQFGDDK